VDLRNAPVLVAPVLAAAVLSAAKQEPFSHLILAGYDPILRMCGNITLLGNK
jgi:hypothetical protein